MARIIVEGLISGLHRSPFHGYSAEFSQYRHYRPGDDLKYVDWKLVARTDRVYTKQFRETTNMAASLVIDASASMAFGGQEQVRSRSAAGGRLSPLSSCPPTKLRYAVMLAAALAHVISGQGDAVGLLAARDRADVFLPARAGRPHLRRLLAALTTLGAAGTWRPDEAVRRAAERLTRRGLLLVLSDFYDEEDRTFAELRRAARMGHEVVLFQIISRDEIDFPYRRDLELEDLETGRTVAINPDLARREYTDAVAAFLERCRMRAGADGSQYSLVITDMRPDRVLRHFLLGRRVQL